MKALGEKLFTKFGLHTTHPPQNFRTLPSHPVIFKNNLRPVQLLDRTINIYNFSDVIVARRGLYNTRINIQYVYEADSVHGLDLAEGGQRLPGH